MISTWRRAKDWAPSTASWLAWVSASKFLRWLAATASTSRPGSFMSPNALVTLPKSNALVTSKAFATSAKPFLVVSFLAMVPSYTPFWVCGILRRTPGIYAVFWPDSRKMLRCNIDCAGPDHQPAQPSCDHWELPHRRGKVPVFNAVAGQDETGREHLPTRA